MLKYEDDSSGNSPLQKESQPSPTVKLEAGPEGVSNVLPSHSLKEDSESRRSPSHCSTQDSNDNADAMADGRNDARAMRVAEIMNDYRTLMMHINSLVDRREGVPPDAESRNLDGYRIIAHCRAEKEALVNMPPDLRTLGLDTGNVPQTERQKAELQRITLDASTRRFQAHKIYLRAAAALRWVQLRAQLLRGQRPNGRHVDDLRRIDQRLRQELSDISDQVVYTDLRNADIRKRYWIEEDPSLDRVLAWIRNQR